MAGIINIIYKKEKEMGMNGDFGLAYGLGALTKPKADLNPATSDDIDFGLRCGIFCDGAGCCDFRRDARPCVSTF